MNNKPTILYDSREKIPYSFPNYPAEKVTLKTGDYSLKGYENKICVERKTHADIYFTIGQHRKRFKEEFKRMSTMKKAVVLIECSLEQLMVPPVRSKMNPIALGRTLSVWGNKDCFGVPILLVENRENGERKCLEILLEFWKKKNRS